MILPEKKREIVKVIKTKAAIVSRSFLMDSRISMTLVKSSLDNLNSPIE